MYAYTLCGSMAYKQGDMLLKIIFLIHDNSKVPKIKPYHLEIAKV